MLTLEMLVKRRLLISKVVEGYNTSSEYASAADVVHAKARLSEIDVIIQMFMENNNV